MSEATPDSNSFLNPLCLNFLIIKNGVTHYVSGCNIFLILPPGSEDAIMLNLPINTGSKALERLTAIVGGQ